MGRLFEELKRYSDTDAYPFHMPGHKRNESILFNPNEIDITEIDGFDNLHHSEGILLGAQKRAAELYGAEETHFLVNGSTAGILSAITACASSQADNPTLLMARNSHKSAYHALLIRNLEVRYLIPKVQKEFSLNGGISPQDVENELTGHAEIQAVFITSPTYDGVVSDVKAIAEICHKHEVPLIVDEAHGAHFGFSDYFPPSSVKLGADIVIHSLHKTLPSYTQTALLHVNGTIVDRDRLHQCLGIYQTSSPSYIFMAGMDSCIEELTQDRERLFAEFAERIRVFYEQEKELKHIQLVDRDIIGKDGIADFDRSKLIFSVKNCGMTGNELQEILRRTFGLELEMAAGSYALALTSICDTDEGFARLQDAVHKVDEQIERWHSAEFSKKVRPKYIEISDVVTHNRIFCNMNYAFEAKKHGISLQKSEGCVSGEFLYLYPPGIPLLVPGEYIDKELLRRIQNFQENEFEFQGLRDYSGKEIQVLDIE